MTNDYIRNGITTLLSAFDVLEGTVLGRCMQCRRHQEFLRFLNAIECAVPASQQGDPSDPRQLRQPQTRKVLRWLARHPRLVFHAVETFFSALTGRRLDRQADHDQDEFSECDCAQVECFSLAIALGRIAGVYRDSAEQD